MTSTAPLERIRDLGDLPRCRGQRTQPTSKLPISRPAPLTNVSRAWLLARLSRRARALTNTWPATRKQEMHTPFSPSAPITRPAGSPSISAVISNTQETSPRVMVPRTPRRSSSSGSSPSETISMLCESVSVGLIHSRGTPRCWP